MPGVDQLQRDRPAGGRSLLDAWDAHVAVLDRAGRIVAVNDAWERFAHDNDGHGVGVGSNYFEVCAKAADTEPAAAATLDGARRVLAGRTPEFALEYTCHSPTEQRWFQLRVRAVEDATTSGLVVTHENVTAHKRMQDDARIRSLLLDEVEAAVIVTDLDGVVTLWSRGAERTYGWTADEAVGTSARRLIGGPRPRGRAEGLPSDVRRCGAWESTFTSTRRDGSTFPTHVRSTLVRDADGTPSGVIGVGVDVSAQVALTDELARSNRQLQAITASIGEGLCTLDDDGHITYVNPQGLRILRSALDDTLGARLLERLRPETGAEADRRVVSTTDPDRPVRCRLDGDDGDGDDVTIEYVASSLEGAGDAVPSGWVVIFRDISERRARELELSRRVERGTWRDRIRDALDGDGFVLHAQPIVEIATGCTVQHELLLRMRDPAGSAAVTPPSDFLPTAEELGLAPAIDRWVLARGLEIAATGVPVELNLSATSLGDGTLPGFIEQLLHDTGADPATVVFEITETALIENAVTARRFAEHVQKLGCKLALDDFGTGFGGFSYLKRLPLDFLKIDIEFVRDLVSDAASRHVVDAVVGLARAFGLQTVAEGVEDAPTLALLGELGVDFAQGFHLGRPAPLPPTTRPRAGARP